MYFNLCNSNKLYRDFQRQRSNEDTAESRIGDFCDSELDGLKTTKKVSYGFFNLSTLWLPDPFSNTFKISKPVTNLNHKEKQSSLQNEIKNISNERTNQFFLYEKKPYLPNEIITKLINDLQEAKKITSSDKNRIKELEIKNYLLNKLNSSLIENKKNEKEELSLSQYKLKQQILLVEKSDFKPIDGNINNKDHEINTLKKSLETQKTIASSSRTHALKLKELLRKEKEKHEELIQENKVLKETNSILRRNLRGVNFWPYDEGL